MNKVMRCIEWFEIEYMNNLESSTEIIAGKVFCGIVADELNVIKSELESDVCENGYDCYSTMLCSMKGLAKLIKRNGDIEEVEVCRNMIKFWISKVLHVNNLGIDYDFEVNGNYINLIASSLVRDVKGEKILWDVRTEEYYKSYKIHIPKEVRSISRDTFKGMKIYCIEFELDSKLRTVETNAFKGFIDDGYIINPYFNNRLYLEGSHFGRGKISLDSSAGTFVLYT